MAKTHLSVTSENSSAKERTGRMYHDKYLVKQPREKYHGSNQLTYHQKPSTDDYDLHGPEIFTKTLVGRVRSGGEGFWQSSHRRKTRIPGNLSQEGHDFIDHCLQHDPKNRMIALELLEENFCKVRNFDLHSK
ncbi:hypothetical protein GQX74_005827 [Glossina fuscipes]|nr:hypothetical protein GQX74_005827 [Glossina fuscipes]